MRVAITGAATGIGASVAKKMKSLGHELIAYDLHEPDSNSVDQWLQIDLSDPASISNALESTTGTFDVLINNAGLPPKKDNAELVLQVNFLGFRDFLTGMTDKLNANGAIVNTASRAGAMWRENIEQVKSLLAVTSQKQLRQFIKEYKIDDVRAYNLSKEAVIVYTATQTEKMLQSGVRMNSVSPAAVSTDILDDFMQAFGDKVAKNIARVGRAGTAEEVAEVIVFLASPESRWLKGIDVVVDGGMGALLLSDQLALSDSPKSE